MGCDYCERPVGASHAVTCPLRGYVTETAAPSAVKAANDASFLLAEITRLREERRWIPVTERMPEVDSTVLVSWRYGEGPEQVAAQAWYDRHGRFTTAGVVEFPNVTHWQPLPAPASEGEVEE